MVQQMLCCGKARKRKISHTWQFWNIKIPKPPYIISLKIIGLLHFLKFLSPSEKITIYSLYSSPSNNFQLFEIRADVKIESSLHFNPYLDIFTGNCLVRNTGRMYNPTLRDYSPVLENKEYQWMLHHHSSFHNSLFCGPQSLSKLYNCWKNKTRGKLCRSL